MTQGNEEPSAASAGSATRHLTLSEVESMYEQWKRLHCGPRSLAVLIRKPRWKMALSSPWLWWSHYTVCRKRMGVYKAARLATLFVWAFLTFRK